MLWIHLCVFICPEIKILESELWFHLEGVKTIIKLSCNKDQEFKRKKQELWVREGIFVIVYMPDWGGIEENRYEKDLGKQA